MADKHGYRELRTLAELDEAARNGERIEFTCWGDDTIDMPPAMHPKSGGWICVPPDEGDREIMRGIERGESGNKYRAAPLATGGHR